MLSKFLLYKRTILFLHPKQILYRVYYFFFKSKFNKKTFYFNLRSHKSNKFHYLKKNNSIIKNGKFRFINITHKTDYKWQIKSNNKLWLYNLHYFDYLNCGIYKKKYLNNYINNWIDINTKHKSVGLEPYPTSLRIVNWIKYFITYNVNEKKFNNNLFNQIIHLSKNYEYHLLGNHYIANLKAVFFGCIYFNSDKLNKIFTDCLIKLEDEINNQILMDGGHAEFSPMYHAIILEDLLDIISIINFYDYKLKKKFKYLITKKINSMFYWLRLLTHPNDTYCKFNDTSENIANSYSSLLKYAHSLGFKINNFTPKYTYLKNTGYFSYINKNIFFCINVGNSSIDHLSGHTHADTLSFELSYKKNIFFSNGGISTYNVGKTREFERSSANHNTVIVNNRNSSEVWNSFRLSRRIKIGKLMIINKRNSLKISNFYLDYLREYKHTRSVEFSNNKIKILDENNLSDNFFSRLILRPDIRLKKLNKKMIVLYKKNISIKLHSLSGNFKINKFQYKKEFGLKQSTFCIDLKSNLKKALYEIIFT